MSNFLQTPRVKTLILIALIGVWLYFVLTPVVNTLIRYASLFSFMLIWTYLLWWFWPQTKLRYAWLGGSGLLLALLVFGGRAPAADQLQQAYVSALQRYEGSPYVWGGENHLGIDCSGLARAAMIDAQLQMGLTQVSPAAFRQALSIWFYDAGADTLAAGFRGKTRQVLTTPAINQLDHQQLQPGDMMVDAKGVHAMIYLGDKTWIEADPNAMRVIRVTVPTNNHWFQIPSRIVRWQSLENA